MSPGGAKKLDAVREIVHGRNYDVGLDHEGIQILLRWERMGEDIGVGINGIDSLFTSLINRLSVTI